MDFFPGGLGVNSSYPYLASAKEAVRHGFFPRGAGCQFKLPLPRPRPHRFQPSVSSLHMSHGV
jgi:hypothetical protein